MFVALATVPLILAAWIFARVFAFKPAVNVEFQVPDVIVPTPVIFG